MNWNKFLIFLLVGMIVFSFCFEECIGQDKKQKPSKPEPPERNIPEWTDASGSIPEDKKEAKKATVFEHFPETAECKMAKPFMIYFYWPDEEKPSKKAKSKVKSCAKFEKNLAAAEKFKEAAEDFGCYKCNVKELDKKFKKDCKSKYSLKSPRILIFDATGKEVYKITKFPKKDKSLAKKLKKIKKASDKAVEDADKKKGKKGRKKKEKEEEEEESDKEDK